MTTHPESQQLSALLDGELTERERIAVEAHVAACRACAHTLDALRATLSDLATLSDPRLDEQAGWSIRAAIAAERAPAPRRSRVPSWIAGGVAASVVALLGALVVTQRGSSPQSGAGSAALSENATRAFATSTPTFTAERDLAAHLDRYAMTIERPSADAVSGAGSGPAPAVKAPSGGDSGASAFYADEQKAQSADDTVTRCDAAVQRGARQRGALIFVQPAIYKRERVLLLHYEVPRQRPTRLELWVVETRGCVVRYFAQRKLPQG